MRPPGKTFHHNQSSSGFRSALCQAIQTEHKHGDLWAEDFEENSSCSDTNIGSGYSTDVSVCSTKNSLAFLTLKII
jgi:hypothetical protein